MDRYRILLKFYILQHSHFYIIIQTTFGRKCHYFDTAKAAMEAGCHPCKLSYTQEKRLIMWHCTSDNIVREVLIRPEIYQ